MFTEAPAARDVRSSESAGGHYYEYLPDRMEWVPLYVEGGTFTLREARKLRAEGRIVCPSVTSIFKVLHKDAVWDWVKEQVALVAWDTDRSLFANREQYTDAVIARADAVSSPAMVLGTAIHAGVEAALLGRDYDASVQVYVEAVMKARAPLGIKTLGVEQCCGSQKIGYAGRCDEHAEGLVICDIKSRKSRKGKVATYGTDVAQIAAYGYAIHGPEYLNEGKGYVFGVSTTEPGIVTVHEFGPDKLRPAFQAFLGMVEIWKWEKKW